MYRSLLVSYDWHIGASAPVCTMYLPTLTTVESSAIPGYGDITRDTFHTRLFGGDQLISARVRGSQRVCSCNDRGIDRVDGMRAVTEDWHTKGILLTIHNYIKLSYIV